MKRIHYGLQLLFLLSTVSAFSPVSHQSLIFPTTRGATTTKFNTQLHLGVDEATTLASTAPFLQTVADGNTMLDTLKDTIFEYAERGGPLFMAIAVALSDSIPLVPTQPISIIAGALFGLKVGLPAVISGQALATTFAFLFGRYVLANSDWNVFDQAEEEGADRSKLAKVLDELTSGLNSGDAKTVFWTIFLARQSPVLPFSVGNYFVGAATQAPILPALFGTLLGCLPLNIVWVGAGAGGMAAVDAIKENGALAEGLEAVGLIVTLGLVAAVARVVLKVYGSDDTEEVGV